MSTTQNNLEVLKNPQTVERFKSIYQAVNRVDLETAAQNLELEKFNFSRELSEKNLNPNELAPMSIAGVFLDVISNGLSFGSAAKHVYLMTRNVKSGRRDEQGNEIKEKRLVFSISPDGLIHQAVAANSIDYVTKPVIVYEGDVFTPKTDSKGNQIIIHEPCVPRKSENIIAGYVFVVFRGGKREPFWMDTIDIKRLAGYSNKQNFGKTNALYTANNGQIDPGFFGAKLIKFALKNVKKRGTASANQVDDEVVEAEDTTYTDHTEYQPKQPNIAEVDNDAEVEVFNTNESF